MWLDASERSKRKRKRGARGEVELGVNFAKLIRARPEARRRRRRRRATGRD
jgi:hypothetical protein